MSSKLETTKAGSFNMEACKIRCIGVCRGGGVFRESGNAPNIMANRFRNLISSYKAWCVWGVRMIKITDFELELVKMSDLVQVNFCQDFCCYDKHKDQS